MNKITGVVLAGGKSKRMKTDKALIKFNKATLIETQIALLSLVFNDVVISANSEKYSFLNKKIIYDKEKCKGPIGGILSTLKSVNTEFIFVLSVDMPFVNKELILNLISDINNYDIVVPVNNGKYEPTCAVYSKNCIKIIESQLSKKDNKLINLINICNTKLVNVSKEVKLSDNKLLANLNYQKDLDFYSQY